MQQVDIKEATSHFPDLLEAALKGEEVVITREDQPIAKIVPFSQDKPRPIFGSAKGLITMSEDFDEPLEDFREYME